jgi:hypothetical protein
MCCNPGDSSLLDFDLEERETRSNKLQVQEFLNKNKIKEEETIRQHEAKNDKIKH